MYLINPTETRYMIVAIAVVTILSIMPVGFRWLRRSSIEIKTEATDFMTRHLAHLTMLCHTVLSIVLFFDSSLFSIVPGGYVQEHTGIMSIIMYTGLLLWLLGNLIRVWGVYYQGDIFEKEVRIRAAHHLLTGGPYQLSRHPIYLGNLLAELGLGIALLAWPLVLFTILLSYSIWNRRAKTEEKLLHNHFGKEYQEYCKRIGRWMPFA